MKPQEFVKRVNDAVDAFLRDPEVAEGIGVGAAQAAAIRENILDDPELAAAAREGFEANTAAQTYALGYAAGHTEAAIGVLSDLRKWVESSPRIDPTVWNGTVIRQRILAEIEQRLESEKR